MQKRLIKITILNGIYNVKIEVRNPVLKYGDWSFCQNLLQMRKKNDQKLKLASDKTKNQSSPKILQKRN